MIRPAGTALALALLLAACTSSDGPPAPPTAAGSVASTPPAVEASPTPPRPPQSDDPFAPPRTRFAGRVIRPIPLDIQRDMRGETWRPGCPVPLGALALLRFNYWGFDGEVERGPMVVNSRVAEDVLSVFEALFRARFPIRHVVLARRFRPNADPDSRRSITASFNCRPVVTPDGPGDAFSQHAYGLAVDVNSLQNPYVREDGFVRNRFARPYVDRSQDLPGMIHGDDVVVRAFAAIGWRWGGDWSGGQDYMHFSLTGR